MQIWKTGCDGGISLIREPVEGGLVEGFYYNIRTFGICNHRSELIVIYFPRRARMQRQHLVLPIFWLIVHPLIHRTAPSVSILDGNQERFLTMGSYVYIKLSCS